MIKPVCDFPMSEPAKNVLVPMVVSQHEGRERTSDIYSMLLADRIIYCCGPIEDNMANNIVAQLMYLDSINPTKEIQLYINSPGGQVTSGFAIIDAMHHISAPVSTICMGMAMSMGSMILIHGEKGRRFSMPNCEIMFHQPSGGARGMASDIEIQAKNILGLKAKLNKLVAEKTGNTIEAVDKVMDRDTYMSAEEALAWGAVDEILTK